MGLFFRYTVCVPSLTYKNGKTKTVQSSNGARTEYTYDNDGNIITETVYRSENDKTVTAYKYELPGLISRETVYVKAEDIEDPLVDKTLINADGEIGVTTNYTYDKNGNLKTVETPDRVTTTYQYDRLNRQTGSSVPGKDEYGRDVEITTSVEYTWDGQPQKVTDARGLTTRYYYNKRGLTERIIDADGGVTAFWYDRAGRLIAEVAPKDYDDNKSLEQMNRVVYTYNKVGQIQTKTYVGTEYRLNDTTFDWEPVNVNIVQKAYKYDIKAIAGE